MKVWHLISNRWNSAISEYALSAAKASRVMSTDSLVTCLADSPIESRFKASGFDVKSTDGFGPGRFARLSNLAKQFSPDVIFTYGGPESTAAFFFKGKARLIRFYGYKIDSGNPLQATTRKLGNIRVDHVIAPSRVIAESLLEQVHCPVDVVTLGVDASMFEFKDLPRAERPELLIFGRIDPVKGHREFMRLFKKILALSDLHSSPRPKLKIVGLPANLSKTHLLEYAKDIGLAMDDFDIQCDRISNVSELLSKVSLGVVSSLGSEAICRVAEEFLLCGTPVVTTNVGSLPEVFTRGEFGIVYGDHENDAAAKIIFERLMASHGETANLRESRALLAKAEFSIEAMSAKLRPIVSGSAPCSS
jgi:glycosyltransferase involved in cell wall biosynthesis